MCSALSAGVSRVPLWPSSLATNWGHLEGETKGHPHNTLLECLPPSPSQLPLPAGHGEQMPHSLPLAVDGQDEAICETQFKQKLGKISYTPNPYPLGFGVGHCAWEGVN